MGLDDVQEKLPSTETKVTLLENVPTESQLRSWETSFEDSSNNITFKLDPSKENESKQTVDRRDITKYKSVFTKKKQILSLSLSDIRLFTFFMCLIVMLTNALTVGYRNSVITTIEKRFEFSSMSIGILSGFLEIGSLITTLIISYFFSNSHIPKCVAVSSVVCALASFMYSLPQFISNPYNPSSYKNTSNNKLFCSMNATANYLENNIKMENFGKISSPLDSFMEKLDIKSNCLLKPSNFGVFLVFAIANFLIGSTSAPLYTLGTSYIDSHVHKDNSSIYLGKYLI